LKVLFLQGGLPHYYTLVLNKLHAFEGIEIGLIIPKLSGMTVGSGVEQNRKDIQFPLFELPEYKTYYSKPFFRGFEKIVEEFKPDILVTGWPYMMHFVFYPTLKRKLKNEGKTFIYKDIPFNIPPYGGARKFFRENRNLTESLGRSRFPLLEELKFLALTKVRKWYLNMVDAHIYYTPEAIPLMATYGIPSEKIFISANSPDTDILLKTYREVLDTPNLLEPNAQRLIHVGRLVKWKRVDLLIQAVSELSREFPQIELLVAGYGPEENALKELAHTLGVSKRVRFLGGVYDPLVLGHYLHESKIYVLAGMGGLSINDAMCFAKPVICSVADGTEKQLVREGENGYFFQDGNLQDLIKKIKSLLGDSSKIESFGKRSLEIIQNEINIHTVLDAYIRAFKFSESQSTLIKN
jgi:glycosyltransferase involved in cell wall biosynthesis